jgi:hypothetical protein
MVNVFCTKLFSKKSLETINSEMISMKIVQNIRSMRITRKGGNLNVFRAAITIVHNPDDPHEFGECMYRGRNREKFSDILKKNNTLFCP